MGLTTLSIVLMGIGILLWVLGKSMEAKPRGSYTEGRQIMNIDQNTFRNRLVSLQVQNPDLPAVPPDAAFYEVWFQEALKRVKTRSVARTIAEETKLRRQINDFQA